MIKQNFILLSGVLILALVLVVPVAATDTMAIKVGDGQTAPVGTAVTTPPSVMVKDANNTALSGVSVTFTVTEGGGTVSPNTVNTNTNGIAKVTSWTLGTTAGSNKLTASASTPNGTVMNSPLTFTATGTAGAATLMAVNTGNGQTATVGTAVTAPPSVIVKDANNNPVSGVPVTFTISLGSGIVSPTTAITTNTNGIAAVSSWTLGTTAGTNSLIATSGSLTPITFTATGTPSTSTLTIGSISPPSAVNSGQQTIEILGTGFNGPTVTLTRTGQSTITSTVIGSDTATTLSRTFALSGIIPGTWNLVIVNPDGGNVTRSFTVNNATAATVTSISPTSGTVNTTVSTTISGTGFIPDTAKIRLYRSGNYIGGAVNSGGSTTHLAGSFNLDYASPGTYDVCVLADGTEASKKCGPTFAIYSDISGANGSIYVKSTPSGSKVFLTDVYKGYTPITLEGIIPGTYTVDVIRTGYRDYSESVKVTAGNTSNVSAALALLPSSTTEVTTVATPVKTATTIKKSTLKVPTTWPSTAPTEASPVDPVIVIGAVGIGIGLVALRRR